MNTRRQFIATMAASAAASSPVGALAAEAKTGPNSSATLSGRNGPEFGSVNAVIRKLKGGQDLPMSFLHRDQHDLAAWKAKGRAKMLELLQYAPAKCDPNAEVVSRKDCGDYIREEVRFNTTPVFRVPATVLIPKKAKLPAPAVVALHSHGGYYMWGREREVETSDAIHPTLQQMRERGYSGNAYGIELVRRGYVVIAIDMFYWGERRVVLDDDPPEWKARSLTLSDEQVKAYHTRCNRDEEIMAKTLYCAGVSWAGIIAWDDIRTVDYLITRPDVDPNRIACVGQSVGGLRSSYLAALDDRIKAAVVSSWMCSFPNQLEGHIRGIGFTKIIPGMYHLMDHPDIASLAMPKPLMVINGSQDRLFELAGVHAAHEKLAKCYVKAGVPEHFKSIIEDAPHQFNAERQADAWAWFEKWV
jgi:dienelactone hydrolase